MTNDRRNVGILIFDDVEVLDFAGPFEVFSRTRLEPGVESRRSDASAPFNVFDGLELTAEQHAQVRVLTQESREARKAIFARQRTGKAPSDADREELLRQAEAHNAAVRALLTPAQQARLAANFEVLRARHAEAQKAQFEAKRAATIRSAP